MDWINLLSYSELESLIHKTVDDESLTVLLFKHSTRCSISSMAKSRLDRLQLDEKVLPVYLDLIAHRDISNAIAEKLGVEHESPQLIVIKKGAVVSHVSHNSISKNFVEEAIA
jgi:bacillithiol system protein YtxJ